MNEIEERWLAQKQAEERRYQANKTPFDFNQIHPQLDRSHPDVQRPWADWSEDQTIHVAVAYSNPFRWEARRKNANNCRRHMTSSPNVMLHMIELAYGDRPWEVVNPQMNPNDIALRTNQQELFFKENLLKLAIKRFPPGWKYGMICDADFMFTRHDWALETIHQLQHYAFVQPFSSYADVSGGVYGQAHVPVRYNSGFFFNYIQNGYKVSPNYHNGAVGADEYEAGVVMRGVGATGGALAFRRDAYDTCGPFPDRCILGHCDWYVAFSLAGVEPPDIHSQKYHPNYKAYVNNWRDKASMVRRNVGYTDCHAIHFWHGSKSRRAYSSRDVILANHQYDPYADVIEDWQGVLQLDPRKPELRDDIRRYMISRFEDNPELAQNERLLV